MRIPIGEGVKSGAKDDELPHASLHRQAECVLRKTAASGDKEAQGPPFRIGEGLSGNSLSTLAQDLERQGIVKDAPMVE
jgi:hypothetical protein